MRLEVGSLFTGIYGIELGLERTGYFRTVWMVENDEFCRKILKKHRPEIPLYGDIREIDWDEMPRVDMLTGGFPCQDISCANPKGKGIEGSRSGLWKEYSKAIGALRPRYALVENVPAIVRKGLNVVLADLAEAGYDAEWFDLRASDFGAPHKRERIFIVAYSNRVRNRGGIQSETLFGGKRWLENEGQVVSPQEISVANRSSERCGQGKDNRKRGYIRGFEKWQFEENQQARDRREFGIVTDSRIVADGFCHRLERFTQEKLCRGEGFLPFQDIRRIEDLQGRPDIPEPLFRGARDGVPDWVDRIKSLGNAVVPDCAEFIGELIMEFDKRMTTTMVGRSG